MVREVPEASQESLKPCEEFAERAQKQVEVPKASEAGDRLETDFEEGQASMASTAARRIQPASAFPSRIEGRSPSCLWADCTNARCHDDGGVAPVCVRGSPDWERSSPSCPRWCRQTRSSGGMRIRHGFSRERRSDHKVLGT